MDEKTIIYHILEIATKKVMVSSLDEEKLTEIYKRDYDSKYDFIWSYDGEPISNPQPDGFYINGKPVSFKKFMKSLKGKK